MRFSKAKTARLEAELAAQYRSKMEAGAIAAVKAEIKARRIKRSGARVRVVMKELCRRGWIAGIYARDAMPAYRNRAGQNSLFADDKDVWEGCGYYSHNGDTNFAVMLLRAAGLEVEFDDPTLCVHVKGLYVPRSAREILAARVA